MNDNENRQKYAVFHNFYTTKDMYVCFCPAEHGNPSRTDHSKHMIQFCSFIGQHSFHHNPDSFHYPCTNISSLSHTCPEHTILHIPKTRKLVIITECRGQKTGPHLIFTWWVVGLQCDFKWENEERKNEICEKRRVHFLTHRPTSAKSI